MTDQRIWLLRHGQSEWNAAGRWQGHGDPPLTELGRRQAREVAPEVAARVRAAGRPVRLFSSDLRRAVETAAAVARHLELAATALPELREHDIGAWSGLTRAEIAVRDPEALAAFDRGDPDVRLGGAESRREMRERVRRAVEGLAGAHPEHDLLLAVHLGVILAVAPERRPANCELVETSLAAVRRLREADAR